MSVGYCGDPDTEPAGKLISRGSDKEEFESGIGIIFQAFAYDVIPSITHPSMLDTAKINAFSLSI
jgi:hypothetical protein